MKLENKDFTVKHSSIAPVNKEDVKLKRVLKLRDLVVYGIILIQPIAALPLFGHADEISRGNAVSAILVAMIAMIFTAYSYGKMANLYPEAGSAYTYVSKSLHPYLGFIAGWSMFMDYLFIPILCVIFTSIAATHLLSIIPYIFWIFFFSIGFTIMNLNGIKMAAKANLLMMIIMTVVVFYFMAACGNYILNKDGLKGLFSIRPFYSSSDFSVGALGSATALAALTYIGFDGLTTLSEEVENPRRNIMLAAIITCVVTGVWSGLQIYLAQLSWPDWSSFTNGLTSEVARNNALDTAIMAVAKRVGGPILDASLSVILLIGSIGSGVTAQIGASRLLYGMGRDGVIPSKIFGHLDRKNSAPSYNVMIVGALCLIGALLLNYEECAHLINFGAFFAFMGVNIASIRENYFKSKNKNLKSFFINFLPSAIGFVICLIIWLNLPLMTFIIGGSWMFIGIVYLFYRSKGFRDRGIKMDFS